MHKLSTAVPQSSSVRCAPTARPASGYPLPWANSASFHRYGGVRGERDGVELAKRRRRDVWCIAFSLLLDLASQAPSANITISIKRGTERTHEYACGALPRTWRNALIATLTTHRHDNLSIIPANDCPRVVGNPGLWFVTGVYLGSWAWSVVSGLGRD